MVGMYILFILQLLGQMVLEDWGELEVHLVVLQSVEIITPYQELLMLIHSKVLIILDIILKTL